MSKWNKKPSKNYGVNFMLTNYCWALGLPGVWLIQPVTPHWRKLKTIWKKLWKLYYSISFQKYTHTWKEYKWNHHIMKQIRPQLNIVCHQVKPLAPVISYILFSCWWKSSHWPPSHTHYTLKIQQVIANASTTWWYGLITQDEIYLCLFGKGCLDLGIWSYNGRSVS